jgi:hypothetical protein
VNGGSLAVGPGKEKELHVEAFVWLVRRKGELSCIPEKYRRLALAHFPIQMWLSLASLINVNNRIVSNPLKYRRDDKLFKNVIRSCRACLIVESEFDYWNSTPCNELVESILNIFRDHKSRFANETWVATMFLSRSAIRIIVVLECTQFVRIASAVR